MDKKMAYPHTFIISGQEYYGIRKNNEIHIPYEKALDINIGGTLFDKIGDKSIEFQIIDFTQHEKSTLGIGTNLPHTLTLTVKNLTAKPYIQKESSINIENINGGNIQVGNGNIMNISVKELTEKIVKSDDKEAKSKLLELLENPTVANILGASYAAALSLFLK